jgi:Tol biopolymer transport system component
MSPDGRAILFQAPFDGSSRIWLMDADGTNARPLGLRPSGREQGEETRRGGPDRRARV